MKKLYIYILLILCTGLAIKAQHFPVYSQYMFNGLSINPAYAGSREVLSISGSSRSQWTGINGAPRSQYLSAHMPFSDKKIGVGIQLTNDKIGVTKNTGILLHYSYKLKLGKGTMSIGLSGALQFISSHWQDIRTGIPSDIVFENNYEYTRPNIGAGIYYLHSRYYLGISSPYILNYSEDPIINPHTAQKHLNLILTSGYLIPLNKHLKLKPSFLLKSYPDYSTQLDINCNLIFNDVLWTGFSLRTEDAIVWLLEYQINPQFRLGYAHDFSFNSLSRYTKGSNEFLLRYEFGYKTNASGVKFF